MSSFTITILGAAILIYIFLQNYKTKMKPPNFWAKILFKRV